MAEEQSSTIVTPAPSQATEDDVSRVQIQAETRASPENQSAREGSGGFVETDTLHAFPGDAGTHPSSPAYAYLRDPAIESTYSVDPPVTPSYNVHSGRPSKQHPHVVPQGVPWSSPRYPNLPPGFVPFHTPPYMQHPRAQEPSPPTAWYMPQRRPPASMFALPNDLAAHTPLGTLAALPGVASPQFSPVPTGSSPTYAWYPQQQAGQQYSLPAWYPQQQAGQQYGLPVGSSPWPQPDGMHRQDVNSRRHTSLDSWMHLQPHTYLPPETETPYSTGGFVVAPPHDSFISVDNLPTHVPPLSTIPSAGASSNQNVQSSPFGYHSPLHGSPEPILNPHEHSETEPQMTNDLSPVLEQQFVPPIAPSRASSGYSGLWPPAPATPGLYSHPWQSLPPEAPILTPNTPNVPFVSSTQPDNIYNPRMHDFDTPGPYSMPFQGGTPFVGGTWADPMMPGNDSAQWATWADTMKSYDQNMVKDWKEDIDTMLVFAGLFSAVVTAFIIQFYPQDDPADMTNILLASLTQHITSFQVTGQFINSTLISTPNTAHNTSPPPLGVIRTQILWFTSLILSLTAALFGFLVKMWLREYLTWLQSPSDRRTLLLRQFRYEGVLTWRIPEIIHMLPVLIQLSVVLFFGGLLILLWPQGTQLFGAVSAFALASLFLVLATVLLPLVSPNCPYKSPLAWTFVKLKILSFSSLRAIAALVAPVVSFSRHLAALTRISPPMVIEDKSPIEVWKNYDFAVLAQNPPSNRFDSKVLAWLYRESLKDDTVDKLFACVGDLPPFDQPAAVLEMIGASLGYSTVKGLTTDLMKDSSKVARRTRGRTLTALVRAKELQTLTSFLAGIKPNDTTVLHYVLLLRILYASTHAGARSWYGDRAYEWALVGTIDSIVYPLTWRSQAAISLYDFWSHCRPYENLGAPSDLQQDQALLELLWCSLSRYPEAWGTTSAEERTLFLYTAAATLSAISQHIRCLNDERILVTLHDLLKALGTAVQTSNNMRLAHLGLPSQRQKQPDIWCPVIIFARRAAKHIGIETMKLLLEGLKEGLDLRLHSNASVAIPGIHKTWFSVEEHKMTREQLVALCLDKLPNQTGEQLRSYTTGPTGTAQPEKQPAIIQGFFHQRAPRPKNSKQVRFRDDENMAYPPHFNNGGSVSNDVEPADIPLPPSPTIAPIIPSHFKAPSMDNSGIPVRSDTWESRDTYASQVPSDAEAQQPTEEDKDILRLSLQAPSYITRWHNLHYGPGYGPVLLPIQIKAVQIHPTIHPVLRLPASYSDRQLVWDMREATTWDAMRRAMLPYNSDPSNAPATFPRVQTLRIIPSDFPAWTIMVLASSPQIGVTCLEVIDAIGRNMHKPITGDEYTALDSASRARIAQAYISNRYQVDQLQNAGRPLPRHHIAPDQTTQLRRIDTLEQETAFSGLEWREDEGGDPTDVMSHCTFTLHVKVPPPRRRGGSGDAWLPRPPGQDIVTPQPY